MFRLQKNFSFRHHVLDRSTGLSWKTIKRKEDLQRGEKRKALLEDVDELKKTKKRIELTISGLLSSADDLATNVEQLGQVQLIGQSNAMRKAAKEKERELSEIQKKLDLKLNEIRN